MPTDNATPTTTVAATSTPDSPAKGWELPGRLVDKRTRAWKRRCELVAMFTQALGGKGAVDAVQAHKVTLAAELATIAELSRAAFLAGESGVTADDLVRMSNQASRAEKALGIDARQKAKAKHGNPVASYVAGRVAA